jgi:hypothetical protein
MPLETWQDRLERHFEALARQRSRTPFPIFALEHDLSEPELQELSALLRSRRKAGIPVSPHWLLWVIYATERGYGYAGDEYWQSFEEQTPGWEFNDRYRVVPWFSKFQKAYSGVVPSGPWATHFRIIAWPITHAILPRYLQRHFARTLYDLRFQLARLQNLEPAAVGRLLAAGAHHPSTRFQEFLQQEELTGRIALALIGKAPADGEAAIYPPTLHRITADLEKVRNARQWLSETQRVVGDRFKGIGHGARPPAPRASTGSAAEAAAYAAHPDIKPSLLLRYAGPATWSVVVEVPSFRAMAALDAEIYAFLKKTRCRLNGATDAKPAGWLLWGARRGVLKSWPDLEKSLLEFDQPPGALSHLLQSECRLSGGPIWLFRIGRDGIAREIVGRIVRPGWSYVVLTLGTLPQPNALTRECTVDCAGIRSFCLTLPEHLSAAAIDWLNGLGLSVARTIRVWPAGFSGRNWNGEGRSEWLTTEAPCFGIMHDHPVASYVLRLDNRPATVIEAGSVGRPIFVRLTPLPSGPHSLTVKSRRSFSGSTGPPQPAAEGLLELSVREPEPWVPGIPLHTGLIVTLDPHDADLDTFWENKVGISVMGPESHHVTCKISLQKGDGTEILSEQIGGTMELPITPAAWAKKFAQFVRREDCAWRYLEATAGRLTIGGEELGEFSLGFEREASPLRWVLRRDHSRIVLRLIDETGDEGSEPIILSFRMGSPAAAETCSYAKLLSSRPVEAPGGLFLARHQDPRQFRADDRRSFRPWRDAGVRRH